MKRLMTVPARTVETVGDSKMIGVLRVDADWWVEDVTPAAESILGRAASELLGPLKGSAALASFHLALEDSVTEAIAGAAPQPHDGFRIVLLDPHEPVFSGALIILEASRASAQEARMAA